LITHQAVAAKTPNEHAELEERRNILRRRLTNWYEARNFYVPPLSQESEITSTSVYSTDSPPESAPLKLPSMLPPSLRMSCLFKLGEIEFRYRLAQGEDALSELRRLLRVTMGLHEYKAKQIRPSQRAGTRARTLLARFRDKVSRSVERYKAAHRALAALEPDGDWSLRLRPLTEKDVRAPGRHEDEFEGTRELSWIWKIAQRSGLDGMSSAEELDPMSNDELNECEF
jgi:hypothetical protein